MPDYTTLDDDALEAARLAVLGEQERRRRLADAPAVVALIAARYAEDGGDTADLIAAVQADT